jgi:RimJ/RimL family protein N-acetyltransferase
MNTSAPGFVSVPTHDFTELTLRTERLILRPWAETDIDAITEACQDPLIQYYTVLPSPYTRADAEAYVRERAPSARAAGVGATFGVFAADTGELAAAVGLHNISHLDTTYGGDGGIGYWAAPGARGRGYTTEAVREVCRWAFEDLGVALIRWDAIVGNEASWRVAQKVGFTREGTLRSWLIQRGVRVDVWMGSLLRTELRAAQNNPG